MPQKKESNPVRKLNNLSAVVQAHPTLVRQNLNMDSQTFCKIHIERVTTYIFYKKKKIKTFLGQNQFTFMFRRNLHERIKPGHVMQINSATHLHTNPHS